MIKKWTKILVLLGIKESYLFSKNSLGLAVHPFKTLRSLQREKDRSQQLLFLIWPVLMLMVGLIFDWLVLIILSLLMFGYLSYWMMKVWSVSGRDEGVW
ncbi:MAG: hypothetical protein ABII08_00380 [Candidatus Beckwithbacteria bacterium]|nr:hypothetical protein [Patescibacteria group bacterium]